MFLFRWPSQQDMKIAVLLSGGVDSSVALAMLKEQGHDCTAFYLKIWLEDELASLGSCPWEEDLSYAQKVCDLLKVPLKVVNLQKEYWDRVVAYVIAEVRAGRTPNPDMLCNERVKFGAFYDSIDSSFDKVATGHYADVEGSGGIFRLCRVPDPVKDQTYFLAGLSQVQLSRALFPIGRMLKKEVRDLAKMLDLPNKDRKDSQGICFLGKIDYDEFIRRHLGEKEGDLVDVDTGKVVGKHKGFWFYTAGQRHGIPLHAGPWYVMNKDADKNIVYISNKYKKEKVRDRFVVGEVRWIAGSPPSDGLLVKLRHGPNLYACVLTARTDGRFDVVIDGNDQGIAPGQFAVFYDGKYCYGCGVII